MLKEIPKIKGCGSQFKKGNIPWNLGKKMSEYPQTGFQKGHGNLGGGHKKGAPIKEESKIKISQSLTGFKRPPMSPETKQKLRELFLREKSKNWRGGVTAEKYSIRWNKELRCIIRERDNYTCQLCSKSDNKRLLSVHHIDYNKNNCDHKNLVSLCSICHSKTNHNREKWIDYFTN